MTAAARSEDQDKPVSTLVNELAGLVIAYVRQETVVPIKSLGKFVAFGAAGAVMFAFAGALLALAAVRLVQSETGAHLHGDLSWVAYAAGVLLAAAGAGWAATRILKAPAHK
ncbi:MAG: hypothetical protein ACRDWW_01765 [Acidimicrobiales bacterium]